MAGLFLILGATFMLVAAIGLLRLPDLLLRMSATAKAATLGAALMVLGASLHFGTVTLLARAAVIILFLFMTAPVAAHMIGRAGYRRGAPLWDGTLTDEAQDHLRERPPDDTIPLS